MKIEFLCITGNINLMDKIQMCCMENKIKTYWSDKLPFIDIGLDDAKVIIINGNDISKNNLNLIKK